ncbi:MAG: hypothetical protein CL912_13160 [Deltaproteobacteria bacterium]|nr:hypothetical protein [Deltaproteobacteria bacterium]
MAVIEGLFRQIDQRYKSHRMALRPIKQVEYERKQTSEATSHDLAKALGLTTAGGNEQNDS